MHGGDEGRAAPRARAKKAVEKRCAEDYPPGALLVWPSPPVVRIGPLRARAPSPRGVLAFHLSGGAFVRFETAGRLSEPTEMVPGQRCKEE